MSKFIFSSTLSNFNGKQATEFAAVKKILSRTDKTLVTRKFEPQAMTYQKQQKIFGRVLNMYDYFNRTTDATPIDLHIRLSDTFDKREVKIIGLNPNESDVMFKNQRIANVKIAPGTRQLIGSVIWLNQLQLPMSIDTYDRRGFKACTQYYHLDGTPGHTIMFDLNGIPTMEIVNMWGPDKKLQTTGIKLLNYHDADYLFADEDELWGFFKKEIEG